MNDDEMLTAEEVAQIMKTSIKTVRGWVQSGELAHVPIGKREYRIIRRDLNAFIAKRRQQGTGSSEQK
jgi:excisionase family DNA binding protein